MEYLDSVAVRSFSLANKHLRWLKRSSITRTDNQPVQGYQALPFQAEDRYVPPMEDAKKVLQVASEEQRKYLLAVIHTAEDTGDKQAQAAGHRPRIEVCCPENPQGEELRRG